VTGSSAEDRSGDDFNSKKRSVEPTATEDGSEFLSLNDLPPV
jgi:hypothetical protein